MTNYEKYRESIDLILQKDTEEILAFNKKNKRSYSLSAFGVWRLFVFQKYWRLLLQ